MANSEATKLIPHSQNKTILPYTSTWNSIDSRWIDNANLNDKIIEMIHNYWKPHDITLQKDQVQSLLLTPQNIHLHEYHNLHLYPNSICKFKVQNNSNAPLNIIIYNDIIIHQNAQFIIENTENDTNSTIQCHGILINHGTIMINNKIVQTVYPLINSNLLDAYRYNTNSGAHILDDIIRSIDPIKIYKWKITEQYWLVLKQFCHSISCGHFHFLPKMLKICSIMLHHYNEKVLSNIFSIYNELTTINQRYHLFAMDLVINGDQFVHNYNATQKTLFVAGFIRHICCGHSIPMQIQSLILLFDSELFNIQIDIDILDRLTQLFDFEYIGLDALRCISRIVDHKTDNNPSQIQYMINHHIITTLLNNLSNKTTADLLFDVNHKRITEVVHILYQLFMFIGDKISKYIEPNHVIHTIRNFIQKMKTITQETLHKWQSVSVSNSERDVSIWSNVSLQFEIVNLLLLMVKYCYGNEQYIDDIIHWMKWFELNALDPQCQQLLRSERASAKLYNMSTFDHKDIQFYASRLLIIYGKEAIDVIAQQCLSEETAQIAQGLRYIRSKINDNNDDLNYQRLLDCGIIRRLTDILQNDEYHPSLRAQTAMTLFTVHKHWDSVMFMNVIGFLVRFLPRKGCTLKIRKNNDRLLFSDISIEVVFNKEYVDIIDININDFIAYFGTYFECPHSVYEALEFVELMQCLSRLDMWCLPKIWKAFMDGIFISKLTQYYASNDMDLKERVSIVFVHFMNNTNVMGIQDLSPIAIQPSISLLSNNKRYIQHIALDAISKIVIGQPTHVYLALDCHILDVLIPIIVENINNHNENGLVLSAVNVLLHLSDPKIDKQYVPQLLEALSIAINIDSVATLEVICRIYSKFTNPNYCSINSYVMTHIMQNDAHYKHDVLLMNGYVGHGHGHASDMEYRADIIQCCLSYVRIYGNVLQFLIDCIGIYRHYPASTAICNLISIKNEAVMQSVFDHDICSKLMYLIDNKQYGVLKNGTLILSKMTESASLSARLVPHIMPSLKGLLINKASTSPIVTNVLWSIGNIASHSIEDRDMLLRQLLLNYLIVIESKHVASQHIYNAYTWILTNMCNKGVFDDGYIAPILKMLNVCLTQCTSRFPDVLEDICWVCYDFTEQFDISKFMNHYALIDEYNDTQNVLFVTGWLRSIDDTHIIPQDIVTETLRYHKIFNVEMDSNPMECMITLLKYPSSDIVLVALKVIGNIVASGIEGTQYLMDHGLLSPLMKLAKTKYDEGLIDEIYWILSNICAGSYRQIETVMNEGVFELLMDALETKACNFNYKVAKHAFWAISNAIHSAMQHSMELFGRLIHRNVMFAIFKFIPRISDQDNKLMISVLETIELILFSIQRQFAIQLMDACNGVTVLNELKLKDEQQQIVMKILKIY